MVLDLADRITYWNKSAERLYGWSAGEADGKNASELLGVQAAPGAIDPGRAEPGVCEWIGELKQVARDGRELMVESRHTLIRDRDGEPISNLVVNTDITARKILELQFLRAQRLESVGMLAGGIAHDLNNILTPILMAADVIKSRLTDSESLSVLLSLQSSAMRGADMVKQILMFARGAGGERSQFQLKHILRDLEKIIRETFPKSIELSMDVPNDLWIVSGDATQVHQVLLNLCVNARDAMPSGGSLRVRAQNFLLDEPEPGRKSEGPPEPHILVEIVDTGTGMSAETGAKIFEPFFTTKGIGKGTGLGLSTALSIVKSHGGFIKVDSVVKRGTTFQVFLPAIVSDKAAGSKTTHVELPAGHGELLLVVDDDTSIREMTRETLETFGYRVLTAANGGQAIAVFARHAEGIKLVLMDMMMPIMQGAESIEAIRKIKAGTRIILITGLPGDQLPQEGPKADLVIQKPYTLATLLTTINDALKS
jgi:PAS domain S-box-containing protein